MIRSFFRRPLSAVASWAVGAPFPVGFAFGREEIWDFDFATGVLVPSDELAPWRLFCWGPLCDVPVVGGWLLDRIWGWG